MNKFFKNNLLSIIYAFLFAGISTALALDMRVLELDYTTPPTTGQVPVYSSTTGLWSPGAGKIVNGTAISGGTNSTVLYKDSSGNLASSSTLTFNGTGTVTASTDVVTKAYVDSGWRLVLSTWTYNSASVFTVPSDATTVYQIGDQVRWKQGGGFKYGNIASLTSTSITIVVNTDYTIANSAVTDVSVSKDLGAYAFPSRFLYTPTFTGFSAAPTGVYQYKIEAGWCYIVWCDTSDGTSSTTAFAFSLPVTAATQSGMIWAGYPWAQKDAGVSNTSPGNVVVVSAGTTVTESKVFLGTGNSWTNIGAKSSCGSIRYPIF